MANSNSNYSSNKSNLSASAKEALNKFKMETAREIGVNLNEGYNGDLTSKQAGSIGGQMVKKLVQQAENNLK
ncbi:MAG: alpha/beta-type small acid-soluble spore protein [Clostridia bacterium]|nr:alpha/beta-type small acid-soluble spore protein [Clostridia bacterium]